MPTSQVPTRQSATVPTMMGDWCGAAEIAALFGVSRQRVQQIVSRPDFPKAEIELAMGKVWSTAAVREWAENRGRPLHDDD